MSKSHISARLRLLVARDSRHRCGYCLCSEAIVGQLLQVDHLKPKHKGGRTVRSNLFLACNTCNRRKWKLVQIEDPLTGKKVRLFNPRSDNWNDHFRWTEGGALIEGTTAIGRAMVEALRLNDPPIRVDARRRWISAGWHPPRD